MVNLFIFQKNWAHWWYIWADHRCWLCVWEHASRPTNHQDISEKFFCVWNIHRYHIDYLQNCWEEYKRFLLYWPIFHQMISFRYLFKYIGMRFRLSDVRHHHFSKRENRPWFWNFIGNIWKRRKNSSCVFSFWHFSLAWEDFNVNIWREISFDISYLHGRIDNHSGRIVFLPRAEKMISKIKVKPFLKIKIWLMFILIWKIWRVMS